MSAKGGYPEHLPVPDDIQSSTREAQPEASTPLVGVRFTSEERGPKQECASPNFLFRVTPTRLRKLDKVEDHEERLRLLGDMMEPRSRIIYPGDFERERAAIYERLVHELGLPPPPGGGARRERAAVAQTATLDGGEDAAATPSLLDRLEG